MVDTDVTILTTGSVTRSLGVASDRVEGTEMASDTSDLVFEDFVVESSLELSLPGGCGCDSTRLLTTSEDDEVLFRRDRAGVEGSIGNVGLEDLEGVCLDELSKGQCWFAGNSCTLVYLSGLVLRGSEEVGAVLRHLHVGELHVGLVNLLLENEFTSLGLR